MERKNAWLSYTAEDEQNLEQTSKQYIEFLNRGKTERECVQEIIAQAEESGYRSLDEVIKAGESLKPGDKVYAVGMKKIVAMFQISRIRSMRIRILPTWTPTITAA